MNRIDKKRELKRRNIGGYLVVYYEGIKAERK
jgi:hypothetical protein